MRIQTAITEMLGIELPIIGAPMFLVSYPDLVVSVSEAGGIGCFPALNYRTVDDLRSGLDEIRARTARPIGVNIILHKPHNPKWPEQLAVCLEKKVELLIFSLGAARTAVNEAKSVGAKVFYDVTTLKHARIVQKAGADALIAVAQGAGGHAGAITPFSLIPYLKEETGLPVIAAGAISNGRQMAAALALGADAVYVGTRLIATPESKAQNEYKQMLIDSAPEEIVYTETISGIPANWLKKSVDRLNLQDHQHSALIGDADEYKRWRDIWSAGQGVAQIQSVTPAGQVVRDMAAEYLQTIRGLPQSD